MSEKRFRLWKTFDRNGHTDDWGVIDVSNNDIDFEEYVLDEDEVVDLLNSLDDECIFLTKQRDYWKQKYEQGTETLDYQLLQEKDDKIKELEVKILNTELINEQLQEENKELRAKASSWKITCSQESNEKNVLFMENRRLKDENEQLQFQLKNISTQRDEFFKGARENSLKIGQLEKENEQLKKEHKIAIDEMITDYKNLEKENKQLKCINDQLEERLENSGIGVVLKMDCDKDE